MLMTPLGSGKVGSQARAAGLGGPYSMLMRLRLSFPPLGTSCEEKITDVHNDGASFHGNVAYSSDKPPGA